MSCAPLGRSVSIFALIGFGCVSAQVVSLWQEQYYGGMRALKQGRYAEAHTALRAAYDRARVPPVDDEWVARTAFGLGSLARAEGDAVVAERLLLEARNALEPRRECSPLSGIVLNGLGEALLEQGRLDEAEKVILQADQVLRNDPALKQAHFLCRRHLAEIRFMRDDLPGAEEMLKRLIEEERREPVCVDLPGALGVLGRLYTVQHRWAEAEPLLQEAMERDLPLGEQSPALADSRVTLANMYRVQGHIERAEPLLRKAVKSYEASGDSHVAIAYAGLGLCAAAEDKITIARELLSKAIDVAEKAAMSEVVVAKLRENLATVGPAYAKSTRH